MPSTFLLIAIALILGLFSQLWRLYFSAVKAQALTLEIGDALATQVANYLEQKQLIAHTHTYYGGMGLGFKNGVYIYARVYEGELASQDESVNIPGTDYLAFSERSAFISWLAQQSDQSLDANNNSCLSKAALAKTVKFHL